MISDTRPAKVGQWSEPALRVLRERYLAREGGEVTETPEEMCWRVARAIAAAEARFGRSPAAIGEVASAFYEMMVDGHFLPNSPTLMNAGKGNQLQYSACYVLPIGDSMEEIFDSVKAAAIIHQSGGGCVARGAKVLTSEGPVPIEILFERAERDVALPDVLSFNEKTSRMEWCPVQRAHKYETPVVRLFEVKVEGGTRLVTSHWHPFYVLNGDGVSTKTAEALEPGDLVLTSTGAPLRSDTIGPDRAWLYGLLLADGAFGTYHPTGRVRLRLTDPQRELVADAVRIINSSYGTAINVRPSTDRRYRTPMWELSSAHSGIGDLMRVLDLPGPGPKSASIRVPRVIWSASADEQLAFLVGFADGDGHLNRAKKALEVSTTSQGFADDLLYLATALGLRARRHVKPGGDGELPTHVVCFSLAQCPMLGEALSGFSRHPSRRVMAGGLAHSSIGVKLPWRVFRPLLDKAGYATHGRRAWREATSIDGARIALQRWISGGSINLPRALRILQCLSVSPALSEAERRFVESYRLALPAARRILAVAPAPTTELYDLTVGQNENYLAGEGGAVLIHNTGFAFSRLRPKNDFVRSTGGRASGPVSFLRVFNAATEAVKQGGTRRGANMGVLRVDHPDIIEFIECKLDGGISNFNISVAVTDVFMEALARGADYDLINPRTGLVTGRLSAREVFERIVRAAWRTGDPGLVFIDRINRSPANPIPELGLIEATNPCGEQSLHPNDVCNLGSVNVAKFARDGDTAESVNWDELERVVRLAVRFLDDVIEVNPFPLPQINAMVKANRRIGLGVMGWADLLFTLGIPYDSERALELGDRLMAFIKEKGHDQSARLAEERGPFPNWSRSIYRNGRPLRNSAVTTIAPTGTISMIAGCSAGIEPVFALAFEHRVKGTDSERVLSFVSATFERVARERGFYSEALMAEIARHGTLEGVPGVPDDARAVFKTAHEIEYGWHVRHQAAFQRHTDNGVSKTINLPRAASTDDVANAYLLAWQEGCLGITVFRDGCKGAQVLTVGVRDETGIAHEVAEDSVKPRPHSLVGRTYRMETPIGTAYITVNDTLEAEPFEVFVQVGKAGSDTMAVAEALGRLVSLVLRLPSPLSAERRLEEVINQLSRIGGGQPTGFGAAKVLSLPDALARTLGEHIGQPRRDAVPPGAGRRHVGDLCKECGQATLIYEEGCKKCLSCGYNEC
jgi:ribonucleoside-diphosphate reductase alpha chain